MQVRPRQEADREAVEQFLAARHSRRVARLGEMIDPLEHPALVAERDGEVAGVLTYLIDGERCEMLTLHAAEQWAGVGTALVEEAARVAADAGCSTLWLLTTNDNVDALRFYQRRGFRLAELRPGAVDESRAHLKPEIPRTGDYGIPIHDELILERPLT
jgi:GNAT superfamily N-acetyltransferase